MCYAGNEKDKKRNNEKNRTTKSRMPEKTWRKRKLQVNIGSGNHQAERCPRGVMVKAMDCGIVVSEKNMNPFILPAMV